VPTATAGNRFVVDASAAVKQFRDEEHSAAVQDWLLDARRSNHDLLAPPLLRYELGNTLTKLVMLGVSDMGAGEREKLIEVALLGFRFADPGDTSQHAPPLTYYDASYLALAKETGSVLVTYDERLAQAAREQGIAVMTPGA
jgi:predicted nucleic acid-binding protein